MKRLGLRVLKSKNQAAIEVRSSTLSYFSFSSGGFDQEGTMFQTSWVPAWISKSQTLKLVLANSLLARVQDPPSSSRGGYVICEKWEIMSERLLSGQRSKVGWSVRKNSQPIHGRYQLNNIYLIFLFKNYSFNFFLLL